MRRKPNNNGGHNGNNKNNGQLARRRFRPDQNNAGKIKNVATSREKYLNLAREAMAQGDRIEAENYLQHADHYFRVLSVLQEEDARSRAERYDFQERNEQASQQEASNEWPDQNESSEQPATAGMDNLEPRQRHNRYKPRRRDMPSDRADMKTVSAPADSEEKESTENKEDLPYAAAV